MRYAQIVNLVKKGIITAINY